MNESAFHTSTVRTLSFKYLQNNSWLCNNSFSYPAIIWEGSKSNTSSKLFFDNLGYLSSDLTSTFVARSYFIRKYYLPKIRELFFYPSLEFYISYNAY